MGAHGGTDGGKDRLFVIDKPDRGPSGWMVEILIFVVALTLISCMLYFGT